MKGRRWGFVSCVKVACVCLEIAACIVWIVQVFAVQYSPVQEECCEVVAATCLKASREHVWSRTPSFLCSHRALNMALRCCDQLGALMSLLVPRLENVQQMVLITLFVFIQAQQWVVMSEA